MPFNLNNYRQLILENSKIFLGLGGTLVLFLFIFLPTVGRLPGSYAKIQDQKGELSKASQRLQNVNNLLSLQQSLKVSLNLADQALPSSEDVPALMTQIQAIATQSGVTLKALQFGGIAKLETLPYRKITLQAILEGSFENLMALLKSLEKTSRMIDVESLTFDTQKSQGALSASLGLAAYYLPDSTIKPLGNGGETLTSKMGIETLQYLKNLQPYQSQLVPVTTGKSNPFE